MRQQDAVPRYFLYGEVLDDVDRSFLHVERIDRRSILHDWTIRAHAHPDHHQILLMSEGRATVRLEDDTACLAAPCLIVVPALTVHGYAFEPLSNGWVVTIAAPFLAAALEGDAALSARFAAPGCRIRDDAAGGAEMLAAFGALEREFVWSAPARRVAVKAILQLILVAIARLPPDTLAAAGTPQRRDAALVTRYRMLIEAEFRTQPPLPALAARLGVTVVRLNAACRMVAGKSALALVHDRIVIEAKRHLIYTTMNVATIALSLGFADAPYFSRFFVHRTGTTPGRYRREQAGAG